MALRILHEDRRTTDTGDEVGSSPADRRATNPRSGAGAKPFVAVQQIGRVRSKQISRAPRPACSTAGVSCRFGCKIAASQAGHRAQEPIRTRAPHVRLCSRLRIRLDQQAAACQHRIRTRRLNRAASMASVHVEHGAAAVSTADHHVSGNSVCTQRVRRPAFRRPARRLLTPMASV